MDFQPTKIVRNTLAVLLAVTGIAAIPHALFMLMMLSQVREFPSGLDAELVLRSIAFIVGTVVYIWLALWLLKSGKKGNSEKHNAI